MSEVSLTEPPLELTAALGKGERLLWLGRPGPAPWFQASDLLLVAFVGFGLLLTAICWWLASTTPASLTRGLSAPLVVVFFGLFNLATIAVLIYQLVSRPRRAKRTIYALSDSRAFVLRQGRVWAASRGTGPTLVAFNRSHDQLTVGFTTDLERQNLEAGSTIGQGRVLGSASRVTFERVLDVTGLQSALHAAPPRQF